MYFEILPNELLLEVFKHLTIAQIVHAFSGLNFRLNDLLFKHFQTNKHVDFRSISKCDFDIYCSRFLPKLFNQIQSISLSDDNDTPKQIDQFYKYGFTLCQFTHLKSLSLYSIYSAQTMIKIMLDLQNLSNLTHLTIDKCCTIDSCEQLLDTILRLPKLIYCYFNVFYEQSWVEIINSTVCPSNIRYLSGFHHFNLSSDEFDFFRYTPHLQKFSGNLYGLKSVPDKTFDVTPITKLNVTFLKSNIGDIVNILQRMRHLRYLKANTGCIYIDGNIWEKIILNHLPELKHFQWKMENEIYDSGSINIEKRVDTILESFRSRFWLVEHEWFVQCHWNPKRKVYNVHTIPYAFHNFTFDFPIHSKSTCSSIDNSSSYNAVHTLNYQYDCDCLSQSHIQFFNIQNLAIKKIPVGDHFRTIVPILDQLISLDITLTNHKNCLQDMKLLLSRTPRLSSLRIRNSFLVMREELPFQIKNTLIYELDLRNDHENDGYYNNEQCIRLSCSVLGIQCKVLSIDVANLSCLTDLITRMNQLEVLNLRCSNVKWNVSLNPGEREDDVVGWLQQNLQSNSIIITRFTRRIPYDTYLHTRQFLLIERL